MDFEEYKKKQNARFLDEHELDDDALEKLIEEKFNRARTYYAALVEKDHTVLDFD